MMTRVRIRRLLLVALCALAVATLPLPTVLAAETTVLAGQGGDRFSPSSIEIAEGDSVIWKNITGYHNVHGPGFQNTVSNDTWTFRHTFTTAGTFAYVCDVHPLMQGTVVVTAAAAPPPPAPEPAPAPEPEPEPEPEPTPQPAPDPEPEPEPTPIPSPSSGAPDGPEDTADPAVGSGNEQPEEPREPATPEPDDDLAEDPDDDDPAAPDTAEGSDPEPVVAGPLGADGGPGAWVWIGVAALGLAAAGGIVGAHRPRASAAGAPPGVRTPR